MRENSGAGSEVMNNREKKMRKAQALVIFVFVLFVSLPAGRHHRTILLKPYSLLIFLAFALSKATRLCLLNRRYPAVTVTEKPVNIETSKGCVV
jgi:hypothetical protein